MLICTQLMLYGLLYNEINLRHPGATRGRMGGQLSVKFCLLGTIIHSSEIHNILEIITFLEISEKTKMSKGKLFYPGIRKSITEIVISS